MSNNQLRFDCLFVCLVFNGTSIQEGQFVPTAGGWNRLLRLNADQIRFICVHNWNIPYTSKNEYTMPLRVDGVDKIPVASPTGVVLELCITYRRSSRFKTANEKWCLRRRTKQFSPTSTAVVYPLITDVQCCPHAGSCFHTHSSRPLQRHPSIHVWVSRHSCWKCQSPLSSSR